MAWRYPYLKHIIGKPAVDGGQCVRLIQHYIPEIDNTKTWERGEQVIKSMHLSRGLAIANFTQAGNWPGREHDNHAAFLFDWGGRDIKTWLVDWIEIVEQFVGVNIQLRRLHRQGYLGNGDPSNPSNNADAFYIIEHKGLPHAPHLTASTIPRNHYVGDRCPDRNEGEAVPDEPFTRPPFTSGRVAR